MLFLIGGPPRCGKTTLARRLAHERCCSYIPADYLGTAFSNYIPEVELAVRYPAWRTTTVDERFEQYSTAAIIQNYRTKAATTWPGLRDMLIYALTDSHELIVEGYHIEPAFVHELLAAYPHASICPLFLYRTKPEQIQADLQDSGDPGDWVRRSATKPETFERVAAMVCAYSVFFRAEAEAYSFPMCEMEGAFDEAIERAMRVLQEHSKS